MSATSPSRLPGPGCCAEVLPSCWACFLALVALAAIAVILISQGDHFVEAVLVVIGLVVSTGAAKSAIRLRASAGGAGPGAPRALL